MAERHADAGGGAELSLTSSDVAILEQIAAVRRGLTRAQERNRVLEARTRGLEMELGIARRRAAHATDPVEREMQRRMRRDPANPEYEWVPRTRAEMAADEKMRAETDEPRKLPLYVTVTGIIMAVAVALVIVLPRIR